MTAYDQIISRDGSDDPLVPTPVSAQIIQDMPKSSALLSLAQRVPMSSKTNRQPVLSVLPEAYFVSGDTGLKQTSTQDWENLELVAEEIAVIVPIPEAYLDDAQMPVWDQVRPRIAAAIGRKLDAAGIFGTDCPATWNGGDGLVENVPATNTVTAGTGEDLAVDIAALAQAIAEDGFDVTGFAATPGFQWRLIGMRSTDGIPIYAPPAGGQPAGLYGRPFPEIANGAWDPDVALVVAGDWSKAVVGVRQDISFKVFTEGVITDNTGAVIVNLMQQDTVALRAVARFGFAVANPITPLNSDDDERYAFGILAPAGS